MADLAFAPQQNMVAYLEKTDSNAEFHQIVDFLTSSFIHHALTYIHATVDGKIVVITESSVRRDLLFTDDNGIICLTNAQIFDNLPLMGLVRVATTTSLDAQHDSSNIAKTQSKATLNEPNPQGERSGSGLGCQETIRGAMAQIRPEGAPIESSDPPLLTGNKVGSGEDRMEHEIKLRDLIPQTPHDSPLSGGHTHGSDEGSMTLKELTVLCTTLSQKGMKNLNSQQKFQDIDDLVDEEVIVKDNDSGEKGGNTAEKVSTDRLDISVARPEVSVAEPKTPPTTTNLFDHKDVTISDTLVKMKSQKAKEKGVAFKDADDSTRPIRSITTLQPLLTMDLKDKVLDEEVRTERERQKDASKAALAGLYNEVQAQINADHELAARLTHKETKKYTIKERSKLLAEFFERRKKQLAKERAESRSFKEIQKLYTKEQKWVDAFIPIGSEEDEKRVGSRKKRATDDDKAIKYETFDVKSPIVDYESQKLGTTEAGDVHVYKLTRLDGSYIHFSTFSRMLEVLDRQDVLDLHKIVMERFPANDPEDKMSQDVLTIGSTMRIPLLYRGEYLQWVERLMNYLEEQTDGEAMINSIKNGDQPLPRVTQVSNVGTSSTEQPPLKDKSMCNKTAKDLWDALARHMLGSEYGEQDRKAIVLFEYETFKATKGELLLDAYIRYLQVINDLKKCGYSKDNCELNFKFLNNLQPTNPCGLIKRKRFKRLI
nr:hypothetical protein [Tanacetum cinerariifolium]